MNYLKLKEISSPNNIFETIALKITIVPFKPNGSTELNYRIENFCVNKEKCSTTSGEIYESLSHYCEEVNQRIINHYPMQWKVFYLYKELFQKLSEILPQQKYNYFRGQAKNWETLPGLFRSNTPKLFIEKFEQTYKNIAIEYPNEVNYIKYEKHSSDCIDRRANQLALLQHYGLKTSLLDLTRNPYIALLFMVSDSSKKDFSSGVIEAYAIDEEIHESKNIFISVKKKDNNRRLRAQDGAFLFYDKLIDLDEKIIKIPRVLIELDYSPDETILDIKNRVGEMKNVTKQILAKEPNDLNHKVLKKLKKEIELLKEELSIHSQDFNKRRIFDMIHDEIKRKLNEYFYFEESLFPDLYKYIEFLQASATFNPKETIEINIK